MMKSTIYTRLLILIQILFLPIVVIAAPPGENTGEIWVDGPLDIQPGSDPQNPDAAVNSMGNSIFVWDGNPAVNGGKDIFLRVYPGNGDAPSVPVRVNTFLLDNQSYPRLAMSGNNQFIVIWQSDEVFPENPDVDRIIIRSQAFNASGMPLLSGEQLLSTISTAEATQVNADVAALTGGGYVAVWRSRRSTQATDPDNISIQARLIGSDGVALGEQFQVHPTSNSGENYPAVTELVDGGYLVVWAVPQVHGLRFAANGDQVGDVFQINTLVEGSEVDVDVALHEDGRVLVVWKDGEGGPNSNEIRGRMYSPDLVAQGADFRINTVVSGEQKEPRAASYKGSGFFVAWESATSAGTDIEPNSIEGRIVTGNNQFAGSQFQVNEWTEDSQQTPGIGGNRGRIAIAWKSQSNADTTRNVINGTHWLICGIFCDGFEGTAETR